MKKIISCSILIAMIFVNIPMVFAGMGYSKNNIDDYVGKRIVDLNYYHSSKGYYPYKKRLDSKGNMQCVGFVYARLEEKLGLSPDFSSGAGAKDIPSNAPNGAIRTANDGTKYTVEVYKNDGGSHITSNCWVSFGAGSSKYGHVIYVEEVIGDTVYYTESGTNMWKNGTAGTLKKKSRYNFINNCSSGGKYVGTVVFRKNNNITSTPAPTQTTKKPTVSVTSYPTSINVGASYGLRGSISSNGASTTVKTTITNSNGSVVMSASDSLGANSTGNIKNMNVNSKMTFGSLSAGKYTLTIKATNSAGTATFSKDFTVVGNTPTPTTKPVNTSTTSTNVQQTSIRFELESVPKGNLPYGKSFSLKGWFRSDSPIVEARAYMLDANKNVVMQSDKASSTTNNYKIQGYKLDKAMKFNQLAPGGYYLKYYVRDANGDIATWISDMFYIVK